jgi:hypothetical protein
MCLGELYLSKRIIFIDFFDNRKDYSKHQTLFAISKIDFFASKVLWNVICSIEIPTVASNKF